jgi:hypothetical protein
MFRFLIILFILSTSCLAAKKIKDEVKWLTLDNGKA